jgi:hypothetical protein
MWLDVAGLQLLVYTATLRNETHATSYSIRYSSSCVNHDSLVTCVLLMYL